MGSTTSIKTPTPYISSLSFHRCLLWIGSKCKNLRSRTGIRDLFFAMGILLAATSLLSGSVSVQLNKFQLDAQEQKWKSEVLVSPCKEGIITVEGKFNHTMTCNSSGVSVPENRLPRRDRNYNLYVVYFVNCK